MAGRAPRREHVAGGNENRERAALVVARGQARVDAGGDEDADVGAPFGDRLLDVRAGLVLEAHADARMRAREGREVGGQALGDGAGVGDDPQVALDAARELDDFALERVQRRVQRADVAHQGAPGLGQVHAPGAAVEQPDTEPRLEIGQPLAGGGQREMLAFGAARDAARLGDGEDEIERDEVEAHGEPVWGLTLKDCEGVSGRLTWLDVRGASHR